VKVVLRICAVGLKCKPKNTKRGRSPGLFSGVIVCDASFYTFDDGRGTHTCFRPEGAKQHGESA